jgi:hypothetical protein
MGMRSRVARDMRIVLEKDEKRQEGQHFGGNDPEETWRVFLYWFQPFTRPTFRQIAQRPATTNQPIAFALSDTSPESAAPVAFGQ